jgi:DNA invertase Pin-like site-specific DNA recombinase
LRVAAYCRVSSDSDEQESSLESQIAYYTDRVERHTGWICAGVFSDTGSGRNTKKRPEFKKLMELCRKRKVDLILTKSVSRFGRNTLDAIKAMRKLQSLGIDVWFEVEGLRLLDRENRFV